MTSIARRLLDELMGTDRNKPLHLRGPKQHRFNVPDVCKYYLIDFCPFELFMNTKSDVGTCPHKLHDDIIKGEFLRDGDAFRTDYERRFVSKLEDLVYDLERKLRRGRERLETKPAEFNALSPENDEVEEKKVLLAAQIKEMLLKVESLGEQGRISEAREMSNRAERLKEELEKLKQLDTDNSTFRIERRLEQCQTCGAMLVVNDAPLRIQSHYEGRQHNGWARVRQALEEWKLKAPEYFRERARPGHRDHSEHRPADSRGRDHASHRDSYRGHPHSDRYSERQSDRHHSDRYSERQSDRHHSDRYSERHPDHHHSDQRQSYGRHRSRSPYRRNNY